VIRPAAAIRLLIADAQPMLRTGLRTLLSAESDLDVVGETGDGRQIVDLARRLDPDVVLLDPALPGQDGVQACRAITASGRTKVLVLTDDDPSACLHAGAAGVLPKQVDPALLLSGVRTVAAGAAVLPPALITRLLAGDVPAPAPALPDLTDRERQVLVLVAKGLSNGEIAETLRIGETTVKTHLGRVLAKLDLRDRVQAVVFAHESGLLGHERASIGLTARRGKP
jgi:DNA-binding NarL/FixJ family response regulator